MFMPLGSTTSVASALDSLLPFLAASFEFANGECNVNEVNAAKAAIAKLSFDSGCMSMFLYAGDEAARHWKNAVRLIIAAAQHGEIQQLQPHHYIRVDP
jgi:uncharacterized protein YigE (DUF2233 family)